MDELINALDLLSQQFHWSEVWQVFVTNERCLYSCIIVFAALIILLTREMSQVTQIWAAVHFQGRKLSGFSAVSKINNDNGVDMIAVAVIFIAGVTMYFVDEQYDWPFALTLISVGMLVIPFMAVMLFYRHLVIWVKIQLINLNFDF